MIGRWGVGLALALPCCLAGQALASGPRVSAAPSLTCFQDDALAQLVREQMGEQATDGWQLQLLSKEPGTLTLTLRHQGTPTGRRDFHELPPDCPSQQRLVATVAVLAMEHWHSVTQEKASKPAPKTKKKPTSKPPKTRPSTPRKPSRETPQSPRQTSPSQSARGSEQASPTDQKLSQDEPPDRAATGAEPPAQRNPSRARASTDTPAAIDRDQEERDSARLARDIVRRQAQARRQARKDPGPFARQSGLGLGLGYGAAANVGPQLDGWLGAARNRFAMRAGGRLVYALPRNLGPAKLHSGLAALSLELCLRPGRFAPSGALEFWGCLGGTGGLVIAKGQGSDKDQAGLRPVAGPTLTFELPVAQTNQQHWSIAVLGGLNLVRTRFDLRSTTAGTPVLSSYTMPPVYLSVQLRWRTEPGSSKRASR